MIKQIRRHLTFICAFITAAILSTMSFIALNIFEKHFDAQTKGTLDNQLNTIIFRLQTERNIGQSYLLETETTYQLIISIEDNSTPLLFKGSHFSMEKRDALVKDAKRLATEQYGFNLTPIYTSLINVPTATFEFKTSSHEHFNAALAVFGIDTGRCTLVILQDLSEADAYIKQIRLLFVALTLTGIILLALFSYWFSGHAIIPIENNMKQQAEFIAAASHELRSPLAVLQTSADVLQYEKGTQETHFIETIHRECQRMKRLVDDLLTLANTDAHHWSMKISQVEIPTLLIELYDSFFTLSKQKSIRFSLRFLEEDKLPLINADAERLKQVVAILLDNAVTYTPTGGTISLVVSLAKHQLTIQVIDNGPGIPDEHKTHIFDRFYRVDRSRHEKEHYGLGLSIAYEIIKLHHGQILLTDTPGGGCTFTICLPIST